ncbi:MAG: hypothetical protein CVU38_05045 [Chloroflexi bacterium HGW-Chloroflexi-1]|nr:MAG: hypothetical protein CVU38_05045 [Chloroflexi bacterium HGW-Chloroflexi-1]
MTTKVGKLLSAVGTTRSSHCDGPLAGSWLWFLFAAALLPRLILVVIYFNYPIALDDMYQYDMLARSLASGHGYRWYAAADVEQLRPYLSRFIDMSTLTFPSEGLLTTFRAPGYPVLLAGLYLLVPWTSRFGFARLVQVVLSALLAPLVAVLAGKLRMGRKEAPGAGLVLAFYPIMLFYPLGLASEDLFIPLLLIAILSILKAAQSTARWPSLLAGGVLGLAVLTRSILAPFVMLAALWLWRWGKARQRGALMLLLGALCLCLPWAIRNTIIMKHPTFVETSLGYNLFVGYHPQGNGGFIHEVAVIPLSILDDAERDRWCIQSAIDYIRANPKEALLRVARRAAYFMGVEERELSYFYGAGFWGHVPQPWLILIYLALTTPWVFVVVFSIWGLHESPYPPAVWLIVALAIGYALPHLFVLAEPRFHLALVPILSPFAMWGWARRRGMINVLTVLGKSRSDMAALVALGISLALWVWGFAMNWSKLVALMGPDGHRLYLPY